MEESRLYAGSSVVHIQFSFSAILIKLLLHLSNHPSDFLCLIYFLRMLNVLNHYRELMPVLR